MKLLKFPLLLTFYLAALYSGCAICCETADGVRYVSQHYEGDDNFVKKELLDIEALVRGKKFLQAAVKCRELASGFKKEKLACGESMALVLWLTCLECLREVRCDDPELLELAEKVLAEFKNLSGEKISSCYANVFRILMSYYWAKGDVRLHDLTAKRLLLYDHSSRDALMTLLYAATERPYSVAWLGEFLDEFSGKKDALFMIGDFLRPDVAACKKRDKILSWLKNHTASGEGEMRCFLTAAANLLDIREPDFIRNYCLALRQWIEMQEDNADRLPLVILVMSEWRRVEALATI